MKKFILASLFLLPQAYAACTYDVGPIRTFFQTLDAPPSYEGTRMEKELQEDGTYKVTNFTGGWSVQETSADNWKFTGGFCTDTICQDMVAFFRIEDGCLKSGDLSLDVTTGTTHELAYSFVREGITWTSQLLHTPVPNRLTWREQGIRGKRKVFFSLFKGSATTAR